MVVGVLEITLAIHAFSLKEKRSVVKRIIQRTRSKFNVAAAEVDAQDSHGMGVLGFVVVGNDKRFLDSVLKKILDFIDGLCLAEIADHSIVLEHY